MTGITKTISLTIILCLCIIPLDLQWAPRPMPVGAHVVVVVIDEFTHARIPDATVEVWYKNTRYFAGYCARTNESMLVTEWTHDCGDELVFVAWHEDYYLNGIEYTVPYFNDPYDIEKNYFTAFIGLFRKSTNTTARPLGEFPIDVPLGVEFNMMLSCTLQQEDTVFGMAYKWLNINTGYVHSEGMVIVSSNRILETFCDYEWESSTRFYYAFEIGRCYNDANADDDGTFALQIPITMVQDCELGVSVVDSVRIAEVGLFYHHSASTFVYVNESLDCVGDVQVEYGYQPSYVYPAGFISLDDLRIVWEIPENTGSRPWPDMDLADLYIVVVCAVCAIIIICVACWMMKNRPDPVDLH